MMSHDAPARRGTAPRTVTDVAAMWRRLRAKKQMLFHYLIHNAKWSLFR